MDALLKVFGAGKKGAQPKPQEAIQKLRDIEEMLGKKTQFLENKIEHELDIARKNGTRNKRVSIQALKRKNKYQKQLQQIDGTLSTIEFQREALESAGTNTEVLKAMEFAGKALKTAHSSMNVDQVHDIMDDIAEQHELTNEISEAISNPVGFGTELDDDDLLAELDELEQEVLDQQLLNIGPSAELPSVPTTALPRPEAAATSRKKTKDDDDELSELQAWAASS